MSISHELRFEFRDWRVQDIKFHGGETWVLASCDEWGGVFTSEGLAFEVGPFLSGVFSQDGENFLLLGKFSVEVWSVELGLLLNSVELPWEFGENQSMIREFEPGLFAICEASGSGVKLVRLDFFEAQGNFVELGFVPQKIFFAGAKLLAFGKAGSAAVDLGSEELSFPSEVSFGGPRDVFCLLTGRLRPVSDEPIPQVSLETAIFESKFGGWVLAEQDLLFLKLSQLPHIQLFELGDQAESVGLTWSSPLSFQVKSHDKILCVFLCLPSSLEFRAKLSRTLKSVAREARKLHGALSLKNVSSISTASCVSRDASQRFGR